ncbi:MAG: hypothetical protein JSW26_04580, partial [Desulfobacterales bacterium]
AFFIPDLLGGTDSQLIGNVIERQFKSANDWPFGGALSFLLMYLTFGALALRAVVSGSTAICLTLWLFAAGYALVLSRWSRQKFSTILFPILILLLAVFLTDSIAAFSLLVLIIISWIRSGICFQKQRGIRLAVEFLLCVFGVVLAALFTPGTAYGWALGVWMFFLLQSLYFVIFDNRTFEPENNHEFIIDPFEQSSRRAEAILDNCISCSK